MRRIKVGKNDSEAKRGLRFIAQFAGIFVFLLLTSCGQPSPSETPSSPTPSTDQEQPTPTSVESGYPPPHFEPELDAYPMPTPTFIPQDQGYPSNGGTAEGVLLAFDRPVKAGDVEIRGVGPAGLTIFILNVTFMGEPLGSGRIGRDGTFNIRVDPLDSNVQLGIIVDLEAAGINPDSVRLGPGAITVPMVGFFHDTVIVQP